jgi:hypothetical protein
MATTPVGNMENAFLKASVGGMSPACGACAN